MLQSSMFNLEDRYKKLDQHDPFRRLESAINWEDFRPTLEKTRTDVRKSNAGRKPFDAVMMFKGLVIQHFYHLSDEQ